MTLDTRLEDKPVQKTLVPDEPPSPLPSKQIGRAWLGVPPPAPLLAVAAQPAALAQLQGQPARLLEPVDLPRPVRVQPVRRVHRQRQADHRRLQGRSAGAGAGRLSRIQVRRLPGRDRLQGPGDPRRDRAERLGALAADQLLVSLDQSRLPARQERRAGSAWAFPGRRRGRRVPSRARRRPTSSSATGRSATATGSAPTIRAAMCWRA